MDSELFKDFSVCEHPTFLGKYFANKKHTDLYIRANGRLEFGCYDSESPELNSGVFNSISEVKDAYIRYLQGRIKELELKVWIYETQQL